MKCTFILAGSIAAAIAVGLALAVISTPNAFIRSTDLDRGINSELGNGELGKSDEATGVPPNTLASMDGETVYRERGWVQHTDEELGVRFWYPSSYGPVRRTTERHGHVYKTADGEWDVVPGEKSTPCADEDAIRSLTCVGITLQFEGLGRSPTFFSAKGAQHLTPARGAYWGDGARAIRSADDVQRKCAGAGGDCRLLRTADGAPVARIVEEPSYYYATSVPPAARVRYYLFPNLQQLDGGIVLATERLIVDAGIADADRIMDELVGSLEFIYAR